MLPSTYGTTDGLMGIIGAKTPKHVPFKSGDSSIRTALDSLLEPDASQMSL